jgi:Uma2 family endonuclease
MSVELEAPIVSPEPENEGDEGKEKMASMLHGLICTNVITALETYLEENDIGYIFDSSTTFKLVNISRKRLPDVSFVSYEKLPEVEDEEGEIVPDLVVEIISKNDVYSEIVHKRNQYLAAGVRLYWLVDPTDMVVFIYRPNTELRVLTVMGSGVLDGEDVLPGFKLPLNRIFRRRRAMLTATPTA